MLVICAAGYGLTAGWAVVELRPWREPVGAFARLRRGLWLLRIAGLFAAGAAGSHVVEGQLYAAAGWTVAVVALAVMAWYTGQRIRWYVYLCRERTRALEVRFWARHHLLAHSQAHQSPLQHP